MTSEPPTWRIRRARPEESALLGDLAVQSARHWSTDVDFLERARSYLTPPPDYISAHPVFVLEQAGQPIGFYGLEPREDYSELRFLFLLSQHIGQGHGKRLWEHAVETARLAGFTRMRIESDPNAEWFYQAMGAQKTGTLETGNPDFVLGIFWYTLA